MLFIYPMWDSEIQRLGKQKCTRVGYAMHIIADLIGLAGLYLLLGLVIYFWATGFIASLPRPTYWIFLVPFGAGIIGQILFSVSWRLAERKGFSYDVVSNVASWNEDGSVRTFTSTDVEPD